MEFPTRVLAYDRRRWVMIANMVLSSSGGLVASVLAIHFLGPPKTKS